MRVIGMDVHRSFAATAVLEDGRLRKGERVELRHDRLLAWARSLRPDDEVVLEATGNTAAIVRLVAPHVGRVAIANPVQVRAIAWAKVKTDQIDAATLAKLHASGFLPEVWAPDEGTQALHRRVASAPSWSRTWFGSRTASTPSCTRTSSPATRASCSARAGGPGWRGSRCRRTSAKACSGTSRSTTVSPPTWPPWTRRWPSGRSARRGSSA